MVTVVVFQLFTAVTQVIPLPSCHGSQSCQGAQSCHGAHFRQVLASTMAKVQLSVLVNTISLPLKAAAHTLAQSFPSCQSCHGSHLAPLGIQKLNTAALVVPVLVTLAQQPASRVVVLHTLTVADAHGFP